MLCAYIMAGGSGQRFWPLSTAGRPKQLLNLFSDKTMIRETIDRILPLIPKERIFIGTNIKQYESIKKELYFLSDENFILEPNFKDTAAAIGYGATYIEKIYKDSCLLVLPSDHLIKDKEQYLNVLEIAFKVAKKQNSIITLGIKPNKPETGYGYIEVDDKTPNLNSVYNVKKFLEKPNIKDAIKYCSSSNYVWNSGMFVFKSSVILNEIQKYLPNHFEILEQIELKIDKGYKGLTLAKNIINQFEMFDKISIDFGVMEKSKIIKVIPCEIGWNDVGSFTSLEEIYEKDEFDNTIHNTEAKIIDSNNNIIITDFLEVGILGVSDLIIVQRDNKLLVCKKEDSQKIKQLFD